MSCSLPVTQVSLLEVQWDCARVIENRTWPDIPDHALLHFQSTPWRFCQWLWGRSVRNRFWGPNMVSPPAILQLLGEPKRGHPSVLAADELWVGGSEVPQAFLNIWPAISRQYLWEGRQKHSTSVHLFLVLKNVNSQEIFGPVASCSLKV